MKKFFALLLLLFPLFTIAQITYQKGYFIENGTRNECLIKNLAWKNNPTSFEYKLSDNDEPKVKTIGTVSEFMVNNAYRYKRFTVNIDRSETILERLSTQKEPEWKTETLFLNLLVEGKANLYQYEDGNLVKYFFSSGDHSKAEQLVYKEYKLDYRVAKNNLYRQQLYSLMNGDAANLRKFETLRYRKDALVKLFIEYNGATGQVAQDNTVRQNKGGIHLKAAPRAVFNSFNVSNGLSNTRAYTYDSKITFGIGAELEYILPFNNNKWSLFLDPNYQMYKNEGEKGNQVMKTEYNYLELPMGARHYMFLNTNSKFFIDVAYVLSLPLGDPYVRYGGGVYNISRNSNLAIGLGFEYKKFSIEARHNFKHQILDYVYWSGEFGSTNLILGYKIL